MATDKPIPAFLRSTFEIVNDNTNKPMIHWNTAGDGFIIDKPLEFAKFILPEKFKHSQMSSFVRYIFFFSFAFSY